MGDDLDLFAGLPVDDYAAALGWYERLLGAPPTFFATETEAVWELAAHRWVYIEQRPERAGHAMITLLVDDLDATVAEIAARGIEPANTETYDNGVRKVTYRDPDGNEIGFGGSPPSE
jgi:catechol 2,3-dioxygenase-like lactoylglutathione lyase family enzyme